MGKVLHVDDETMAKLEMLARSHGLSVEDQLKAMVGRDLRQDRQALMEHLSEVRKRTAGRHHTPSEVLVRESRDER